MNYANYTQHAYLRFALNMYIYLISCIIHSHQTYNL